MQNGSKKNTLELCYEIFGAYSKSDSLWDFLKASAEILGLPFVVLNKKRKPIAYSLTVLEFDSEKVTAEFFVKDSCLAYLEVLAPFEENLEQPLQMCAECIEKIMKTNEKLSDSDEPYISALIDVLDGVDEMRNSLYSRIGPTRFSRNGIPMNLCVINISPRDINSDLLPAKKRLKTLFPKQTVFEYSGTIVVILSSVESTRLEKPQLEALDSILSEHNLKACIGDEFSDVFMLRTYYNRNAGLLATMISTPSLTSKNIIIFDHFKFDCMLSLAGSTAPEMPKTQFVSNVVMQIMEYDKKNSTDLLDTLHCFIQSDASYVNTAKRMFVHKNTVIYRINRIKELFGVSLETVDERFMIYSSCRILRIMGLA